MYGFPHSRWFLLWLFFFIIQHHNNTNIFYAPPLWYCSGITSSSLPLSTIFKNLANAQICYRTPPGLWDLAETCDMSVDAWEIPEHEHKCCSSCWVFFETHGIWVHARGSPVCAQTCQEGCLICFEHVICLNVCKTFKSTWLFWNRNIKSKRKIDEKYISYFWYPTKD